MNFLKKKLKQMGTAATYRIGRREVEEVEQIAEGGFGKVYLVRDTSSGREYALKKIPASTREAAAAIQAEIDLMASLPHHKNIVRFLGAEQVREPPGLVFLILMEYCTSGHLVSEMNRRGGSPFSESQVLSIFAQMATAVAVLHSLDPPVAHRDLKVENLLLGDDTRWKLCDFGSATTRVRIPRDARQRNAAEDEFNSVTTLAYRAPEMLDLYRAQRIDTQVDVWALGVSLFKIAFFANPFDDSRLAILNNTYQIPKDSPYSDNVHGLIEYMLEPNPYLRPDVFDVLDAVYARLGKSAPIERLRPRPPPPKDDRTTPSTTTAPDASSSSSPSTSTSTSTSKASKASIFDMVGASAATAPSRTNPTSVVPQLSGDASAAPQFNAAWPSSTPNTTTTPSSSPAPADPFGSAFGSAAFPATFTPDFAADFSSASPTTTTTTTASTTASTSTVPPAAFSAAFDTAFPSPAPPSPGPNLAPLMTQQPPIQPAPPSPSLLNGWGSPSPAPAPSPALTDPWDAFAPSPVASPRPTQPATAAGSKAERIAQRVVTGGLRSEPPAPKYVRAACSAVHRGGSGFARELWKSVLSAPGMDTEGGAACGLTLLYHVFLAAPPEFAKAAAKGSPLLSNVRQAASGFASREAIEIVTGVADILATKARMGKKRAKLPTNFDLDAYLAAESGHPMGGTQVYSRSFLGELLSLGSSIFAVISVGCRLGGSPLQTVLQAPLVPLLDDLYRLLKAARTILDTLTASAVASKTDLASHEKTYAGLVSDLSNSLMTAIYFPPVDRLLEFPRTQTDIMAAGVATIRSPAFEFDPYSDSDDDSDLDSDDIIGGGGGGGIDFPHPAHRVDSSEVGTLSSATGTSPSSLLGFPGVSPRPSRLQRAASFGEWPSSAGHAPGSPGSSANSPIIRRPASSNNLFAMDPTNNANNAPPSSNPWP